MRRALAVALLGAVACTFPEVTYQEPCAVSDKCNQGTVQPCITDARQERQGCEAMCNPGDPPSCEEACAEGELKDLEQCFIVCQGCAIGDGCHNSAASCNGLVGTDLP